MRRDGQSSIRPTNQGTEDRIRRTLEGIMYMDVDDVEIGREGDTVKVTMGRFDLELWMEAMKHGV
jgi:hypothetical protein